MSRNSRGVEAFENFFTKITQNVSVHWSGTCKIESAAFNIFWQVI